MCPSTEWYTGKMEHYSALKKKDIVSLTTTWMHPEDTILTEISQSQKDKYCMIPIIWGIESGQIQRQKEWWLSDAGERGEKESYCLIGRVLHDEKSLWMEGSCSSTTRCMVLMLLSWILKNG